MRVTSTTNPRGYTTAYEYDSRGLLTKITDALSGEITYEYDAAGNKTKETDQNGNSTIWEYDALNRVTEIGGLGGGGGCGSCGSSAASGGGEGTYTYYASGALESYTDLLGVVTSYVYDDAGRQTKIIADVGGIEATTENTYNDAGQLIAVTDANGNVTSFTYDKAGRLTRTERPLSESVSIETESTYDDAGNLLASIDPRDYVTSYVYDGAGRMTQSVHDPSGLAITASTSYDKAGNVKQSTNPRNNSTNFYYDGLGRRVKVTDALSNSTNWTFDKNGNTLTATDANSHTTNYTYDELDRTKTVEDADGVMTTYVYDAVGNRIKAIDENGIETRWTYYDSNRLEKAIVDYDTLALVTTYTYDDVGNLESIEGPKGMVTSFVYDALRRRTKEIVDYGTGKLNITTTYTYDAGGRMTKLKDHNGNETTYTYDAADRRTKKTLADNKDWTYTYDLNSLMKTSIDPNESITTYTYDGRDRLTQTDITRGTGVIGTTTTTYAYDALGRMTSAFDNNGNNLDVRTSWEYDALSRVTKETLEIGAGTERQTTSAYDGVNRTSMGYPSGKSVTLSWTNAGRLNKVSSGGTDLVDYDYDSGGALLHKTLANGIGTQYTLDGAYRITEMDSNKGMTRVTGFGYGYDAASNPTYQEALHATGRSELYGYDGAHRLTSWKRGQLNAGKTDIQSPTATQTWNLDGLGNWDSTTIDGQTENRDHDSTNFLESRDSVDLTRDDNGNTLDDLTCSYVYDALNRIVNVKDRTTGDEIATYVYDAHNRRVRKVVAESKPGAGTTDYVYDGWQVVEERDETGSLAADWVYGIYIDEPITMTRNSSTYYYTTNRMYSVAALTNSSGNVVEAYEYAAYGKVTVLDSSFQPTTYTYSQYGNPYLYTGRRLDPESGLYYYRNRYYSPSQGRFLTREPSPSLSDSASLYLYARNNPAAYVDALGLVCEALREVIEQATRAHAAAMLDREVRRRASPGLWAKWQNAIDAYNEVEEHFERKRTKFGIWWLQTFGAPSSRTPAKEKEAQQAKAKFFAYWRPMLARHENALELAYCAAKINDLKIIILAEEIQGRYNILLDARWKYDRCVRWAWYCKYGTKAITVACDTTSVVALFTPPLANTIVSAIASVVTIGNAMVSAAVCGPELSHGTSTVGATVPYRLKGKVRAVTIVASALVDVTLTLADY